MLIASAAARRILTAEFVSSRSPRGPVAGFQADSPSSLQTAPHREQVAKREELGAVLGDQSFASSLRRRRAFQANPLIFLAGIAQPISIPVSACIPPLRLCSDLITARVYACIGRQGVRTHGQPTETE